MSGRAFGSQDAILAATEGTFEAVTERRRDETQPASLANDGETASDTPATDRNETAITGPF